MTKRTLPTFTVTIYVGLKDLESGEIVDKALAVRAIQQYADTAGLCVTVEDTTFIYTDGNEPGLVIGLINYPRFPSTPEQVTAHARAIAELLLKVCRQRKVLLVTPNEMVFLSEEPKESA